MVKPIIVAGAKAGNNQSHTRHGGSNTDTVIGICRGSSSCFAPATMVFGTSDGWSVGFSVTEPGRADAASSKPG